MGSERMGPPCELLDEARAALGLTVFVETGTFRGQTAAWAATRFERVYTIEADPTLFAQSRLTLGAFANVSCLAGDSATALAAVLAAVQQPAVYWLDAHWMGTDACARPPRECPLLDEIDAILRTGIESLICIDDARLLTLTPHAPLTEGEWPSLEVVAAAFGGQRYQLRLLDDVLFAIPPSMQNHFERAFRREANLREQRHRRTDYERGVSTVKEGMRLLRRHYAERARRFFFASN